MPKAPPHIQVMGRPPHIPAIGAPPPIPAPGAPPHIPALDGLRGMAILLVLCFHYFAQIPVFAFAWSGVDLFFVLSGYLITGRLLDSLNQPTYFSSFYRNRILRIFPLYYGVLILFFISLPLLAKNETRPLLSFYFIHWKSFFLFTENWSFIRYGMPAIAYLSHFWSLAVEEQFYLVWPALLYFLGNRRVRLAALIALPAIVLITRCLFFFYQPHEHPPTLFYFNTFFRMDSLVIGALLCQVHRAGLKVSGRLVNALLLFSAALLVTGYFTQHNMESSNAFFETVGYTVTALFYACILQKALTGGQTTFTARIFCLPWLRFAGKISYGLYVFHFPIFLIFQYRFYSWGIRHLSAGIFGTQLISSCACLIITFLISLLSFRYWESFFLGLKKRA